MYDPDWEPDYVTAHTNSGDEGISVPPHSHDAQQGGVVGRHESFFSDWLYHKWRHAGQDQDHIVITVELDHHDSHFHLARNLEHFLLVEGTQARIHRYRDIEESGSLEDGDYADGFSRYEITVEYDYRFCRWGWLCLDPWENYEDDVTCQADEHSRRPDEGCHVD